MSRTNSETDLMEALDEMTQRAAHSAKEERALTLKGRLARLETSAMKIKQCVSRGELSECKRISIKIVH